MVRPRGIDVAMLEIDEAGRGRVTSRRVEASSHLSGLVEHLWVEDRRHVVRTQDHAWRVVPDASPALVWPLLDDGRSGVVVVGPRSTWHDSDRTCRLGAVGARLGPGALPVLFGVDASALTDRVVPLPELTPVRPDGDLPELAVLVRLLDRLIGSAGPLDRRVRALAHAVDTSSARDLRIGAWCARLGIPDRTLRALVRRHIGLSAKRYHRIRRVQRAAFAAVADRPASLAEIALRTGFVDQAHMTGEFRALLGASPARFVARGRRR
jgi:AraC-like DNA-binding protein